MSTAHPPADHPVDHVVIVTGGGSGMGRATAIAFAEAGAHVLGVGRREEALEATAREHPGIKIFAADICSAGVPEAIVDEARRRWGRVDVLVNNAGAAVLAPLVEVTSSSITDLFALNVTAPSMLARAAMPYLSSAQGSIVNVSSTFGHRPLSGGSYYVASKSAVEMLTRCWALELAPKRSGLTPSLRDRRVRRAGVGRPARGRGRADQAG